VAREAGGCLGEYLGGLLSTSEGGSTAPVPASAPGPVLLNLARGWTRRAPDPPRPAPLASPGLGRFLKLVVPMLYLGTERRPHPVVAEQDT
jgi:hypothetical protein